ncbi:MAG: hypothetical protein U5P10_07860 [Spirochaetia bacterium]|nr:hypothetical protein [Spirochaetia bacterium]
MDKHNEKVLNQEIERLKNEIPRILFGSVAITLTLHEGRVSRVEHHRSIKETVPQANDRSDS